MRWATSGFSVTTGSRVRLPDVVALDTNCFIYLFEQPSSDRGKFLVEQVLRPAQRGERRVVTPALVVQELLAQPRSGGSAARATALARALDALPGLSVLPMTTRVASLAARLGAAAAQVHGDEGLSLSDAVVLATAVDASALLITNDRRLAERSKPDTVMVLDDLVSAAGAPPVRLGRRRG